MSCGAVRGRGVGCWAAANAPITTSTTGGTTTTSVAARVCRPSDLKVTLEGGQGAGGTMYSPLAFRNRSVSACSLIGHPSVSFLDRAGRVIGAAKPVQLDAAAVTLFPGQQAGATLGVASISLGECQPVTPATVRVVLPGGGAISVAVPAKGAYEHGGSDFAFCPGGITSVRPFQGPA